MNSDDESKLGDAMRRALNDLIPDVEPSQQLKANVAAFGQRRSSHRLRARHVRRRLAASLAGVGAAVVVLIAVGQTAAPSFAVTVEANHRVRVTLYELRGSAGANARLKALKVRAQIVPIRSGCPTHVALTSFGIREQPVPTITLIPSSIPAGTTLVLGAKRLGSNHLELAFGRVTGKVPACVAPGSQESPTGIQH